MNSQHESDARPLGTAPEGPMIPGASVERRTPLPAETRRQVIELARRCVREAVTRGVLPAVRWEEFPASLRAPGGCFVTLTNRGTLRGCIGNLRPQGPLIQSIMANARSAATRDHRFPPVRPEEVPELEIEISLLTPPRPLDFTSPEDLLAKLEPQRDGVVLEFGTQAATFLPQVWEHLPDKARFLAALSQKAGWGPEDWRRPGTRVWTYRVEAFSDSDFEAGEPPSPGGPAQRA